MRRFAPLLCLLLAPSLAQAQAEGLASPVSPPADGAAPAPASDPLPPVAPEEAAANPDAADPAAPPLEGSVESRAEVPPPPAEALNPPATSGYPAMAGVAPTAAPYGPPSLGPFGQRAMVAQASLDQIARLGEAGEAFRALDMAESLAFSETLLQTGDTELPRVLMRNVARLRHPDREPAWFWAGIPLAIAGGIGGLLTGGAWALDSIGTPIDNTPYIAGLVLAGAVLVTGVVMLFVGGARNAWDSDQRDFRIRQRAVRVAARDQYRTLRERARGAR